MAGRPKVTDKVNDNDLEKKNKELEQELAKMKKILEQLMAEKNKQNDTVETETTEEIIDIPLNKPIKVMSLYTGGLNLKKYDDDRTPTRFNNYGEVQPILYSDLLKILSHQRKLFEEGYCVILDKEVIKVHYLEKHMEKILDKKTIDKFLEYDNDKIKELFTNTTKQIRQTIVDLILNKIVNNEYVDRNKVAIISELYGNDLYKMAEHLK